MEWFAKNGDKVLSLVTVGLGAVTMNASSLGLDPKAMAWVLLAGTLATAAHTLFYPNSAPPKGP